MLLGLINGQEIHLLSRLSVLRTGNRRAALDLLNQFQANPGSVENLGEFLAERERHLASSPPQTGSVEDHLADLIASGDVLVEPILRHLLWRHDICSQSRASAFEFVRRFKASPEAMHNLRSFVWNRTHSPDLAKVDDNRVLDQVASWVASGEAVVGFRTRLRGGGTSGDEGPAPEPVSTDPTPERRPAPVYNPPGEKKEGPKWTPAQIKKSLDDCDGGTGVWAAAKQANGGKDPTVKPGTAPTGGFVDSEKGEITLDQNLDRCFAIQIQIQELANQSHKQDFANASKQCRDGALSREQFIRAYEQAEFDGVHKVIQAFDACKDKWGCKTCEKEWARQYQTFDDYYNKALSTSHKEHYGQFWDSNCKAAYEAKQAPPAGQK